MYFTRRDKELFSAREGSFLGVWGNFVPIAVRPMPVAGGVGAGGGGAGSNVAINGAGRDNGLIKSIIL